MKFEYSGEEQAWAMFAGTALIGAQAGMGKTPEMRSAEAIKIADSMLEALRARRPDEAAKTKSRAL